MAEVGLGQVATLVLDRYDDTTNAKLAVWSPPDPPHVAHFGPGVAAMTVGPPRSSMRRRFDCTTVSSDGGKTWTGIVEPYDVGGLWYQEWTITGMGYGRIVNEVSVIPDRLDDPGFSYATSADLARWTRDAPPDDCERMLASASREIDRLIMTAVYPVDAITGKPLDRVVAEALRDATCELVQWWSDTGDDSGATALYGSMSAGSVSVGRATAANAQGADSRVSPQVRRILAAAGLLGQPPTVTRC